MEAAHPVIKSVKETFGQARSMIQWVLSAQADLDFELQGMSSRYYECRITRDKSDLRRIFQLRYEVFRQEYSSPRSIFGLDIDHYDRFADHLVVIHKETGNPVGTYRLIPEDSRAGFYSEREFDMSAFLEMPGRKLELGRACVHPDHRNGAVLRMLWRGLLDFAQDREIDLLFGCSSIHIPEDEFGAAMLHRELRSRGAWGPISGVRPTRDFVMPERMQAHWALAEAWLNEDPVRHSEEKSLLPPLVASYIRSGARVISAPAYDEDFHCLDLLTVFSVPGREVRA
jgi:putative hemolysin